MKHFILLALALVSAAANGANKPATAPARVRDGLVNGSVRFLVPADWELLDRAANGLSVTYQLPDEKGRAVMVVTQQAERIPLDDPRVKKQMAQFVLDSDNADLANRKMEIIDAPKIEPDARFILKVHERFKDGDTTVDAVHLYRGVGLNLVSVTISINAEDKDEAKHLHDAGALMLLSVNLGVQDKRIIRPVPPKE